MKFHPSETKAAGQARTGRFNPPVLRAESKLRNTKNVPTQMETGTTQVQPASTKALDGGFLIVENFDDFRDSAIVEDKTNFQGEVGDFQLGALVLGRDVAGDKIADAVAVDEIDSFEIEDEFGFSQFELFFHQFLHRDRVGRRFRQPELALHPQNKDIVLLFDDEIHGPPPLI
jgi:hypothetical protein